MRLDWEYTKNRRCEIRIDSGALRTLPVLWNDRWRDAVIIGDDRVLSLHGALLREILGPLSDRVFVHSFAPGEASKTRETAAAIQDGMIRDGCGRSTCVIGFGGGISLDLAGYVAATFMRGVPWIAIPTSLLAQVDASIGGKTGVNTPLGKNLVGAFHPPVAVLMDTKLPSTLPRDEWLNGMVEGVKHAVVADSGLFTLIEENRDRLAVPGAMELELLERIVEVKLGVVSQDPEEQGIRSILNFGHSIGHAIESGSAHAVPHGRAVALGMIVESRLAVDVCRFPVDDRKRLVSLLATFGCDRFLRLPFEGLIPFLERDKKNLDGTFRFALPENLGSMAGADDGYTVPVQVETLRMVWEELQCSA